PKRPSEAGHGSASPATAPNSGGHTTSAPKRHEQAEFGRTSRAAAGVGSGRAASPANRPGRADDDGRGAAGPQFDAGERGASRAPVRGHDRFTSSAAKRLAYAAGQGAVERSPALARHLAALNGCGASPGSRSRYIPVAVRREVWRRDQGCCSYVDPHSGRRCGSRYRLEIDHVVPFALGGATELWNLRIRCRAHHRLRHAPRHAHPASGPNENPGAP
ncbi:MAG: HNH endonuclease signature motif containing protein, partial [Spirochaetaceae bacterium]|nr:HNH endonuclease signature motif containing protein [Spirochaetaceae bacterium]